MEMPIILTKHGNINTINFTPQKPSGKTIVCIHGLCCDARIFQYLAQDLTSRGFSVISIDLFGHGMSDGKKGDPNFDDCLDSLYEIIFKIKQYSKVYLLSHSIGCTYSLWYLQRYENTLDGLILLAPYVRVNIKKRSDVEPNIAQFLYLLLRRIISPGLLVDVRSTLPNYTKVGGYQIESMIKDKLLNFKYSLRYLVDVVALKNQNATNLSKIDIPVLILHGKKDRQVYPQVSEAFFKMIKSEKKSIQLFDCDHWFFDVIFYEQTQNNSQESRNDFLKHLSDWLERN